MKTIVSILVLFLSISCTDKKTSELDFLVGIWKSENKEQFEVWEKTNTDELKGYSYRIKDKQKNHNRNIGH